MRKADLSAIQAVTEAEIKEALERERLVSEIAATEPLAANL